MNTETVKRLAMLKEILKNIDEDSPYKDSLGNEFYTLYDDELLAFAKALQGDGEPVAWMWDNNGVTEYTQDIYFVEYYSSIYGIKMKPLFNTDHEKWSNELAEKHCIAIDRIKERDAQIAELTAKCEKMREACTKALEYRIALYKNGCDCGSTHTCNPLKDSLAKQLHEALEECK